LAQVDFAGAGAGTGGAGFDSAAVTSTSSLAAAFAAGAGNGSALRAATVWGAASARGEEVQNQTPAITTAATTLANIRPNGLRIALLSSYSRAHTRRAINANKVLTPHQHDPVW
jgi:hypothetical protein